MVKKILFIIIIMFLISCESALDRRYRRAKRLSKSDKQEKWEEAIEEFDEIIKMQVNAREYQSHIYRKLGKRHMQQEHWNDALHNYKKAIEILPNEAILHTRMGVCYSKLYESEENKEKKMELLKKAEQKYKLAISLNSKYIDPYFGLGIIYFYVYKNYAKGIEYMKEVIRRDDRNIDAHFALGRFYYEKGDLEYAKSKGEKGNWKSYFMESLKYYEALLTLVPEKDPRYEQVVKNIQRINYELPGGPG